MFLVFIYLFILCSVWKVNKNWFDPFYLTFCGGASVSEIWPFLFDLFLGECLCLRLGPFYLTFYGGSVCVWDSALFIWLFPGKAPVFEIRPFLFDFFHGCECEIGISLVDCFYWSVYEKDLGHLNDLGWFYMGVCVCKIWAILVSFMGVHMYKIWPI